MATMFRLGSALCALVIGLPAAVAQEIAADWTDGERHRVRIFAGAVPDAAPGTVTAFVEMAMDRGWKTYWKNPGTAGGIPPEFTFDASKNVAKAEVLYPVPTVMNDKAGDVIGYREYAIFPVRITPADAAVPVELAVTANYGICEKLCVPAETVLALTIPPGPLPDAGPDAARAYTNVPRTGAEVKPGDPTGFKMERLGSAPGTLRLSAHFPGDAASAAMFLAVPDGRYLPLPVRGAVEGETIAFDVAFSNADDLKALKGATVTVVMAGEKGQSEDRFVID
jgi:DsbC/DsbD-like thiol-disulfide interchange protein